MHVLRTNKSFDFLFLKNAEIACDLIELFFSQGSAGSPGLYTQYGGPPYGPNNGPTNSSGPPPGCPSPHRAHHHHYGYGQQGNQGGYIHSQAAPASSSSGGINNCTQSLSHCNGEIFLKFINTNLYCLNCKLEAS